MNRPEQSKEAGFAKTESDILGQESKFRAGMAKKLPRAKEAVSSQAGS